MQIRFIILSLIVFLVVQVETTFVLPEAISVAMFAYFLMQFIDDFGKKLVILDVVVLTAIFLCLIMPITGYHHFNATNKYARVWTFHMRVPVFQYYAYMLPATIALIVGLKANIFYRKSTYKIHEQYMISVKAYLADTKWQGFILVVIGLISSFIAPYAPGGLGFIFLLLRYLMFVGAFYCIYSRFPNKRLVLISVFGLLIFRSISAGMFGELVFMGIMTIILLMLGSKVAYGAKFSLFVVGIFGILVLQSVKPAFRKATWGGGAQNKLELFTGLLQEKIMNPGSLFENEKVLFASYLRFNEGQIISRVMYNVPERFPYADGETIFLSLAATVVPRVLWPTKPEAGGAANFERFVGIKLKGYSIGLSPFGEAYGNFGAAGGIVYMLFFGLMFNFFFQWLLKISVTNPSLILWFPFLFFYAVQIESDTVTMVNSFTKAALFTWGFYKVFPAVMKMKI